MTLDDLPLATRALTIGGRRLEMTAVADQDALLRVTASRDLLPFGLMLWESAIVLGETLATMPLAGVQVLELGAGVGLAGIAAAAGGAWVMQTDIDELALGLCARNAAANGLSDRIVTATSDWHAWRSSQRYDLIIGADVLYDRADHAAIARLIEASLNPGGRVLLTDPGRLDTPAFLDLLGPTGWSIATRIAKVPDLARPSRSIAVTLIEAERPTHCGAPPTQANTCETDLGKRP